MKQFEESWRTKMMQCPVFLWHFVLVVGLVREM